MEGADARNTKGYTLLMEACQQNNIKKVHYLIKKRANLNLRQEGKTALMMSRSMLVRDALIEAGANAEYTDNLGHTFLYHLLDEDEYYYIMTNYPQYCNAEALWIAILRKWRRSFRYISARIVPQPSYRSLIGGDTSFINAIGGNYEEAINYCMENADMTERNNNGQTVLMIAVMHNRLSVVEQLVTVENMVNARDYFGNTALMYAMEKPDICRVLLNAGAHIEMRNYKGDTALLCQSDYNCFEMLVQAGANIDIQNNDGNTALLKYTDYLYNGDIRHVRLLMEKRARLDIVNNKGQSVFTLAALRERDDIAYLIGLVAFEEKIAREIEDIKNHLMDLELRPGFGQHYFAHKAKFENVVNTI